MVLPTHIGAVRIAEMILYPTTTRFVKDSPQMRDMKRGLHEFGLELEVVTATTDGAMTGETVGEAEHRGQGAFFIVQVDRANGQSILHPGEGVRIEDGAMWCWWYAAAGSQQVRYSPRPRVVSR